MMKRCKGCNKIRARVYHTNLSWGHYWCRTGEKTEERRQKRRRDERRLMDRRGGEKSSERKKK